jgi:DNA repair exonuclease SbcCD ATPase subunit
MDLFNPPIELNYTHMSHNLNVEQLENPYIQVVWEDVPENFTTERIKRVKSYFENKYKSKNVNVITKVKTEGEELQSVDVSVNILDENYQRELIGKYLETRELESMKDQIVELDKVVEGKIAADKTEITPFKKWYIKKIEFSNFLSFGDNQVLDFDKVKGISTVESNPPNFGGKTVLTVDLLLFLFFNTTTKSSKAEEIFNRFRDKNTVSVKGEISIDGEDYVLVRNVDRKLKRNGEEYTVSTKLDFFKKLADGSLQNFTGEQRRETEAFIKSSIGTMEDFLMTILTTATNLEELIDAKPTARGQVLSRFLGLDSLKLKEETGKELYSTFSKGMLSNIYNVETLKQDIEEQKENIKTYKGNIKTHEGSLVDVEARIEKGQSYRDELIQKKHTGLDQELISLKPQTLEVDINEYDVKIVQTESNLKEIKVEEPKEYYHEDKHDEVKEKLSDTKVKVGSLQSKISDIKEELEGFDDGVQCQYCGIVLAESEYTDKKKSLFNDLNIELSQETIMMEAYDKDEKTYVQLKKDFEQYERNKLIKEKYEIQKESLELKKKELVEKLRRYKEAQTLLEENKKIDETLLKADMRLEELKREKEGYMLNIQNLKNQIEKSEEKIESNNEKITQIAEEFEKEKVYKLYQDIFGKNGISKMIMKTMMPVINSELQRLLSDSAKFKLEVRINDKNEVEFIQIDNETQIEKLISSGSGYERTISSLALRAVLSKVCSLPKPNVIVFDEVFGKISNENLEMVYEFFVKIKSYFDKILIITHNPMLSQWSDGVIKIEKTDNVSKVVQ